MTDLVSQLRAEFPFHLDPINPGDDGEAFAGFLHFATGESVAAAMLRDAFFTETGMQLYGDATAEQTGQFIDWLIVNAWGKADGPLPH